MGRRFHEGQHLGYGRWSAHLRDRRLVPQRLRHKSDFVADGNYAWEWWYQFQVTDNISVTPAIYYLSRPYGDLTMVVRPSVAIVVTTASTTLAVL